MPSLDHESLLLLFHNQPELAAQLLREALHVELPAYTEARVASSDLSQIIPAEFGADAVVLLMASKPVLGVIIEVQLSPKARKRFSWPSYMAVLRARHECPVELLVLTPDAAVARWAAVPIELDLSGQCVIRPRVLGPQAIPVVTDPAQAAREPELAVLSALAHGGGETELALAIATAAASGLNHLPADQQLLYLLLIRASLGDAARKAFEMYPEAQKLVEKFAQEHEAKGKAEGKAETLRKLLTLKFGPLSEAAALHVATASEAELDRYLERVLTAQTVDTVLAG
ncbi:MAG TPA: hypothetical protein VJN18_24270 [Polyangiaceae bacterium]|nr:hypothetical protein [Polyangiaceae bacterium]